MQQVLIEFAADTSGMAPADKALTGLTDKEKALADQSMKTAAALTAQGKATTDSANQGTKSVDQLSTSFKNLDKALLGGAYKTTFDQIRKNLNLTDKELKAFYQNIIKNSRTQLLDSSLAKQDFDALSQLVKSAQSALDSMGKSEDVVGEKSVSMRQRLKELKQDLQTLEDQGKDNTVEFERMQIAAGKLQDQIGDTNARIKALSSDTFVFDALASGLQGVAGAFAVAQGAAALFGADSEEVQKALLKVNAAMAILQGLQTIQNVLQKQSAASIAVDVVLRRNQAAATGAQALATEGATVAQEGLNAAFAANPVGLILIGITALITALTLFGNSEEEAAKHTKELNDLLLEQYNRQKDLNDLLTDQFNDRVFEAQRKLNDAQAAGIGEAKKLGLEYDVLSQSLLDLQKRYLDTNGDTFLKKLQDDAVALKLQLDAFGPNLNDEQKVTKDALQSEYNLVSAQLADQKKLVTDYHSTFIDFKRKELEIIQFNNEQALKSATSEADAEVALRKQAIVKNEVDSFASLKALSDAEIKAIKARLNEELQLNKNLSAGERRKLIEEANLAILENYKAINGKIIENEKLTAKAQVTIAKEGSQEELNAKLVLLDMEQKDELAATEVTAEKKREIESRYLKQRLDLIKAYNKQVAEDSVNAQINTTNSQLSDLQRSNVSATNNKLLELKKNLIDEQAALEVIGVQYSEKNEELRRVKIQAIYDKALADKRKLEEDKLKTEIDNDNTFIQKVYQLAKVQQQAILDSSKSTEEQKKEANRQITVLNDAQSDAEFKKLEEEHNKKLITEEEYLNQLLDLKIKKNEEANALLLQQAEIQAQKEQTIRDTVFNAANQLISALGDAQQAQFDNELQNAKDLYDQKLISEKEYNNRQKQIKRQEAIAQREAALFNIFLETQQKAMAIQAQRAVYLSNPVTAPLAALASTQLISLYITEGITAALLAAKKLPAFRHGVLDLQGPGTETSDSILARLSKGETVTTAAQTRKHKTALEAIHNDTFEDYLKNIALPKYYPSMPSAPVEMLSHTTPTFSIDYDKMAKTFSEEMAKNPRAMIQFNEEGFKKYILEQHSITEIKNRDFEL